MITFDIRRLTTSGMYLSHRPNARRSVDSSKQGRQDRSSEYSRSQTRPVQISNTISGAKVTFAVDRGSQELYIQVVDRETSEVLREIPPAEMRRLAASLKETVGNFLDSFA
jgi:uncharacterized FlaG/YvyC family protein